MKDSKIIEQYLIDLLMGSSKEELPDNKYSLAAIGMYNEIIKKLELKEFKNPHKPKVKSKPTYGNKNEPKTDVLFLNSDSKYKFSLKLDDSAYIVSCNSIEDFIKSVIDIHNGREVLDKDMLDKLEKCSIYIKKVPNYFSYDSFYMKDDRISDFLRDKFRPKAIKYMNEDDVKNCSLYMESCYRNKDKQLEYSNYLHEAESYIRDTFTELFIKYPEYSKKIIFEFLTGKIKFIKDEDCVPNYLISNEGFFDLDNHECDYVNRMYNKYISNKKYIRLQNVPRKNISRKILKSKNFEKISDTFASADFTFKI
jgi:hypothetical protein